MSEDIGIYMGRRKYPAPLRTEEDDPARAAYLDELARRRGVQPSNWREVLASPMEHQSWLNPPRGRRKRT